MPDGAPQGPPPPAPGAAGGPGPSGGPDAGGVPPLTEAERESIRAAAREELQLEKRRERFSRLREVVGNGAAIAIAAGFYLYHWRRARHLETAG